MNNIRRVNSFFGLTFLIIGIVNIIGSLNVWINSFLILLGFLILLAESIKKLQLEQLKKNGVNYTVIDVKFHPSKFVYIRGFLVFYFTCKYCDDKGDCYNKKSELYFTSKKNTTVIGDTGIKLKDNYVVVMYTYPNCPSKGFLDIQLRQEQ